MKEDDESFKCLLHSKGDQIKENNCMATPVFEKDSDEIDNGSLHQRIL